MKNSNQSRMGLSPAVLLSGAGVILLVGFGVGRLTVPQADREKLSHGVAGKLSDPDGDDVSLKNASYAAVSKSSAENILTEQKLQQLSALSNPRLRERGMEEALTHANLDEVKRALKWAESLPDGPGKKAAMADILERWAQMDGLGATDYAAQLFDTTGNAGPLREALQGWAQANPNAALQKLQSLGLSDGLKADIRTDLVAQWTEQNPQGAAVFAAGNREAGSWSGLVATVANEWSKEDPKTAVNWAGSLPAGLDQVHAINAAISNWFQSNPTEVAVYVSSQSSGPSKDTMTLTLARQIGQEDPASGLKWAGIVSDPKTQEKAAAGAIADAYRKDPQAALQILAGSGLSKTMQDSVTARLQGSGPWWR